MEIQKNENQQPANNDKNIKKVISGTAKIKKKNGLSKFTGEFISEDASNVKTYIIKDVVIPTIKKVITDTIDMFLYGGPRNGRRSDVPRVSYRDYGSRYGTAEPRRNTEQRITSNYENIILDNRGDAEEVLSSLSDVIEKYDFVSIADLNDFVGITGDYTDNRYGWTNLRNAEVIRVRDGYTLKLPRPVPIDK